jgi:hypothetical protein
MESLKAAFRFLGDPSGQVQFVAERLDQATASDAAVGATAAAAACGASGPGTRPSTSSSKGVCYDAWALLDLLMAEWLSRAWGRAQDMARLRRCVGCQSYVLSMVTCETCSPHCSQAASNTILLRFA